MTVTLLSRFGEKVGKEPSQGGARAPARDAFPLTIPQARRFQVGGMFRVVLF